MELQSLRGLFRIKYTKIVNFFVCFYSNIYLDIAPTLFVDIHLHIVECLKWQLQFAILSRNPLLANTCIAI